MNLAKNKYLQIIFSSSLIFITTHVSSANGMPVSDFDGKWEGTISCTTHLIKKKPPFSQITEFDIREGEISANQSSEKDSVMTIWSGSITNGAAEITGSAKRNDGSGSWIFELSGTTDSNQKISFIGEMHANGVKIRDCTIEMQRL